MYKETLSAIAHGFSFVGCGIFGAAFVGMGAGSILIETGSPAESALFAGGVSAMVAAALVFTCALMINDAAERAPRRPRVRRYRARFNR
jgi:hypothetical protein